MSEKTDRAEAKAEAKAEAAHEKAHPHKKHDHGQHLTLVRAGNQLVSLAHVVSIDLPVEGDPKQPLTLKFVTGVNLQLVGDDADAVMEALSDCCDCAPTKVKPAKAEPVPGAEEPEAEEPTGKKSKADKH